MSELMAPADVPEALVRAAQDALHAAYEKACENGWPVTIGAEDRLRIGLAAVLPLYGKQLRANLAAALDAKSDEWRPGRDFAGSVSEFHEFRGKASGFWDAARIVEKGSEDA